MPLDHGLRTGTGFEFVLVLIAVWVWEAGEGRVLLTLLGGPGPHWAFEEGSSSATFDWRQS